MLAILIALALGIGVGVFGLAPLGFYKIIDKVMVVVLLFLLFHLAVGIGSSQEIFSNLSTIGLTSFLLALGSIVGSVLMVYLVQKKWFQGEK